MQIRALEEMKTDGRTRYGVDLSRPAANCPGGGAGRVFRPIWPASRRTTAPPPPWAAPPPSWTSTSSGIWRPAVITEAEAQELIDQFIIKLRLVRHLRTPEYNELFGGDPTWVTESIGGMGDRRASTLVTQNSFRYLHTPEQPGHRAGAEPHRAVDVSTCPKRLRRYLRQNVHPHRLHPVRK